MLASAELEGERVLLRPRRPSDAGSAFAQLFEREEILRWLVWDGPQSEAELAATYAQWVTGDASAPNYHFAIVDAETREPCGAISPRFGGHPGQGDIGYWLAEEQWGRGVMTEALRLVNHLCFEHLGAHVLYAYVFVGNEGSRKVLERAGYRYSHLARGQSVKRGRPVDEWYYTATPSTWRRSVGDWRPRRVELRAADPEPAP